MYHLQKSILYNTLTIENNKAHNLLPKYNVSCNDLHDVLFALVGNQELFLELVCCFIYFYDNLL